MDKTKIMIIWAKGISNICHQVVLGHENLPRKGLKRNKTKQVMG